MNLCPVDTLALQVRTIIADHLGVELEKVTDSSLLGADLDCDSLDTVELIMEFEREFSLHSTCDTLALGLTVAQVIDKVRTALAE